MAPFGNGAYGVSAASQVYFGAKPANLTVAQAALLAGMVKAPTSFDPTTESGHKLALDRRDYIIDNMVALKQITAEQAAEAKATKLGTTTKRPSSGCASVAKNNWGFFCDYFYRWWLSQEAFGKTAYERERQLKTGGYPIVTSLDVKAQSAARSEITERIKDSDRNALLLAGIEPGTGLVRSLAANRKFKIDDPDHPQNKLSSDPAKRAKGIRGTYPNTTNPIITGGGDITGYQAGSVFKMFTMVAALENGMGLDTTINAQERLQVRLPRLGRPAGVRRHYCPTNAAKGETGPVQHVDRLRQVGEHLLRAAAGAGRRGQGGRRGEAVRRAVPGRTRTPSIANNPEYAHELGRLHPGRLRVDAAGHRERVRDAGRRRHVLHADADPEDHRPRRHEGRRRPAAAAPGRPARTWPARRWTRPAARSATGPSWATAPARPRRGAPARWATRSSARPAPPTTTRPRRWWSARSRWWWPVTWSTRTGPGTPTGCRTASSTRRCGRRWPTT